MTAVCTTYAKEADKFTPFLNFGSAVKDPKLAFAFTVVWKNNINSTVMRFTQAIRIIFRRVSFFERKRKENFFFGQ